MVYYLETEAIGCGVVGLPCIGVKVPEEAAKTRTPLVMRQVRLDQYKPDSLPIRRKGVMRAVSVQASKALFAMQALKGRCEGNTALRVSDVPG